MNKENIILALSGPSGVGKGYCKDKIKKNFKDKFSEPIIVTTRPKRKSDSVDRKAGVSIVDFFKMKENGLILFPHQPFKSYWYGFLASSFENSEKNILTEIHPENIHYLKNKYENRLVLLGLIANQNYLETNIRNREIESEKIIRERLLNSVSEISKIKMFYKDGLIDYLIEVTPNSRFNLDKRVVNIAREIIKK